MNNSLVRGQVSLEYLVLLAAFIAFLAVWVPIITSITTKTDAAIEDEYASLALGDAAAAVNNACLLGKDSTEKAEVKLVGEWTLSCDSGKLELANSVKSFKKDLECPCTGSLSMDKSGIVKAINVGGSVEIS